MTNLRVFTDKGLDYIHQNISDFFELIKNNKNSPTWIKDFCKKDPTTSSPFSFEFEFEINPLNPTEGDFNNAVKLYELFKTNNIGNALIYNEKFAAGFLYTFGYEYFTWASDLAAETRVSATFFFDYRRGLRQALARNLLTRLYKVVDLTVENEKEDKYELTKFVFDNPALRRMVYYPNLDGPKSSRCFVRAFMRKKKIDPNFEITMKRFENARLKFSALAHVNMLECMDEEVLTETLLLTCFE